MSDSAPDSPGASRRARGRRWPWSRRSGAGVGVGGSGAAAGPRRRTFIDDDVQSRFDRDGYAVVDLLDEEAVCALLAARAGLSELQLVDPSWVDGFTTSLYDPRPEYRERVLADIEAALTPGLERVLVDHRIIIANYMVKEPGASAVPLHADWTFLDEELFSSATVWCPLVDVTVEGGNGAIGVVPTSQERIDFLRIANVACYDRCEAAVADLERTVLDLRAGQAVVYDGRTLHFSLPNESEEARIVAACVVGPAEADLHHYWVDPDDHLIRFELDRSFYLDYRIGDPASARGVLRAIEARGTAVPH